MEDDISPTSLDSVFQRGYGWRARIGMIVPGIVDETASKQFYRMAPTRVTLVKTSLNVRELTLNDITAALTRVEGAARELGRRKRGHVRSMPRLPRSAISEPGITDRRLDP